MSRIVFGNDAEAASAEEQLRRNIRELMEWRHLTQADLAERLGKTQPWVSKRLSGVNRFQLEDLDDLTRVFELSASELLRPGFGKWDRRRGQRRSGIDRRETHQTTPDRRQPDRPFANHKTVKKLA